VDTEKGTMVSRVADEWDEKQESRRKTRKRKKRKRKRETGREGETIVGCGGGRFALKFKYHSRGRALTLRSVEHSGPI